MHMERWTLNKAPRLTEMCYTSKAVNAEKNSYEFWGKIFCLVAITLTSQKVSVTASKQVPGKEKISLVFLILRSVSSNSIYIFWL